MDISERIKELRKNKNLTQEHLAEIFGVSRSTIKMIENGKNKPSYDLLLSMSEYFNVSIDYLVGKSDNMILSESDKYKNKMMVNELIDMLVDSGKIKDVNNIDKYTLDMIVNAIKSDLSDKIKSTL